MPTIGIKLIGGSALAAISALGGLAIHNKTIPSTIREQLETEKRIILGDNDDSERKTILGKSENIEKLRKFLGINDGDISNKVSELKNKCQGSLAKTRENQDFGSHLENAREFCSKEATNLN